MRTVLVKGCMPETLGIPQEEWNEKTAKEYCIRVLQYKTETEALMSYAECIADWSTLLDTEDDVEQFVETATEHMLSRDYNWLEEHFV